MAEILSTHYRIPSCKSFADAKSRTKGVCILRVLPKEEVRHHESLETSLGHFVTFQLGLRYVCETEIVPYVGKHFGWRSIVCAKRLFLPFVALALWVHPLK